MYYVEKQPCVKLHAWPQVQFGIDALCSRRRIKKQFHCIGRLYVVFFTRSLTQFSICWACFMAPRPLKAIQIWLKESTVLIWRYCTLSAMLEICNFVREATQFELLDHISLYSYFLASLFSKMVKSVCLNCPSKEHIQILTGFSRFKNASCQSELEFNSHLRSKGSCFYSRFNIYIYFFVRTPAVGVKEHSILSAFLFISQCTAVNRLKAKTSPNAAVPPPWAQGLESVKA